MEFKKSLWSFPTLSSSWCHNFNCCRFIKVMMVFIWIYISCDFHQVFRVTLGVPSSSSLQGHTGCLTLRFLILTSCDFRLILRVTGCPFVFRFQGHWVSLLQVFRITGCSFFVSSSGSLGFPLKIFHLSNITCFPFDRRGHRLSRWSYFILVFSCDWKPSCRQGHWVSH